MNFENLISPLEKTLIKQWIETPTKVQEKVIPVVTSWKDILVSSHTWSGKTLAFVLPILNILYENRIKEWKVEWKQERKIQVLVLAPTRELVMQIWETFNPYCTNTNFKQTTIFGWVSPFHQIKALKKWVDILVATPWRLKDLMEQWIVKLSSVKILVLDEADRMLDMWFLPDIKHILSKISKDRQTLLFSATLPESIKKLASNIQKNPEEIIIKSKNLISKISQKVYFVKSSNKLKLLQFLCKNREFTSIIVFVRQKEETEKLAKILKRFKVDTIHWDKHQNARRKAWGKFKNWEIKVLIATDVAARWLDMDNLSCVINYDLPATVEDYTHRIWRTARAWKKGVAITISWEKQKDFISEIEEKTWNKLEVVNNLDYLNEKIVEATEQRKGRGRWRS